MEAELVELALKVFGVFVVIGLLGGGVRIAKNYMEQALGLPGKENALTEGMTSVALATLWVILVPTVLFLVVSLARTIQFGVSIEDVVRMFGDMGMEVGGSIK